MDAQARFTSRDALPHFQRCTSRAGPSAGRLMPEPPGNRVYGPIRGHRTRSAGREYPQRQATLTSGMMSLYINIGDKCQDHVSVTVTDGVSVMAGLVPGYRD